MTELASTSVSLVRDIATRFNEPAWLQEFRQTAWELYSSMPAPRLEKTDLTRRSWEISQFGGAAPGASSAEVDELLRRLQDEGSAYLYVRDGLLQQSHIPAEWSERGVVLESLHEAARTREDVVRSHLGTVVKTDESKWAALNAALFHGGVFVHVPKGLELDGVLHCVYEDTATGHGAATRILVVAEESSRFAVAESFLRAPELAASALQTHVLEVVAKPNSTITVVSANRYVKGPTYLATRRAQVLQDAAVDWVFTDVGDGFAVAEVESDLAGTGSRSTVRALGVGYGRQHLDLTASMLHTGRYSTSDITMHGVLRGRANSIFRSSTHIFKNAVGAGSEQSDRMLILEGTARADAIPMLLIDENDVQRCGHAASVGRIDENQIYYLMSRGIPKAQAARMIIWGYLEPTVQAIPSDGLREYVRTVIDRELT